MSKVQTQMNLNVTIKRQPNMESSIVSQTIQIVNKEDPDNRVVNTWLMDETKIVSLYLKTDMLENFHKYIGTAPREILSSLDGDVVRVKRY